MDTGVVIQELGEDGQVIQAHGFDPKDVNPAVMRRVIYLKKLHDDYLKEAKEFEKEVRKVEQAFNLKFDKIYAERAEIIKGEKEAPKEEAEIEERINQLPTPEGGEAPPAGLPKFWLTALQVSKGVSQLIEDADEDALEYLVNIRSAEYYGEEGTDEEEMDGFDLFFEFKENPYFTNTTLTKSYRSDGDGALEDVKGTKIDWKSGKNLTQKVLRKKAGAKGKKGGKIETKTEQLPSFFHFFSPPEIPTEDSPMAQASGIALQQDFELGEEVKDEIIPYAIQYFLGEISSDEEDDDYDGEYDDEDDDEDDDDDDDDSEDDEEDDSDEEDDASPANEALMKHRRQVGRSRQGFPKDKTKAQDQPAECKQQ